MPFGQVATAAIDLAGNGFPMFRYLAGRFKSASKYSSTCRQRS